MGIYSSNNSKSPLFKPAERLSIAQVQATHGFEHMTEQEAEQYLDDLEQFCRIICIVHLKNTDNDYEHRQAA